MAANESKLGELHETVATVLIDGLQGEKLPDYEDEDGNIVVGQTLAPSAAMIQAATKFLKDNNITCAPSEDNTIGELEAIMKARIARKADKLDLATAREQTAFLTGLPN